MSTKSRSTRIVSTTWWASIFVLVTSTRRRWKREIRYLFLLPMEQRLSTRGWNIMARPMSRWRTQAPSTAVWCSRSSYIFYILLNEITFFSFIPALTFHFSNLVFVIAHKTCFKYVFPHPVSPINKMAYLLLIWYELKAT